MSDFERINGPRVDKIEAMIEVIAKSARSQRADASLLAEVVGRISSACAQHLGGTQELKSPDAAHNLSDAPGSAAWDVRSAALDLPLVARAELASALMEDCFHEVLERDPSSGPPSPRRRDLEREKPSKTAGA